MSTEQSSRFPKIQPLAGLRGIKVTDLPRDIAAGITLAAMIIPLNIGFDWRKPTVPHQPPCHCRLSART